MHQTTPAAGVLAPHWTGVLCGAAGKSVSTGTLPGGTSLSVSDVAAPQDMISLSGIPPVADTSVKRN